MLRASKTSHFLFLKETLFGHTVFIFVEISIVRARTNKRLVSFIILLRSLGSTRT